MVSISQFIMVIAICFLSLAMGFYYGFVYCGKMFARALEAWILEMIANGENPQGARELLDKLKELRPPTSSCLGC